MSTTNRLSRLLDRPQEDMDGYEWRHQQQTTTSGITGLGLFYEQDLEQDIQSPQVHSRDTASPTRQSWRLSPSYGSQGSRSAQRDVIPLAPQLVRSNAIRIPHGTRHGGIPPAAPIRRSNAVRVPRDARREEIQPAPPLARSNAVRRPHGSQRDEIPPSPLASSNAHGVSHFSSPDASPTRPFEFRLRYASHPSIFQRPEQSSPSDGDISSNPAQFPGVAPYRLSSNVQTAEEAIYIATRRQEAYDALEGTIPAPLFSPSDLDSFLLSKTYQERLAFAGATGARSLTEFYRKAGEVKAGKTRTRPVNKSQALARTQSTLQKLQAAARAKTKPTQPPPSKRSAVTKTKPPPQPPATQHKPRRPIIPPKAAQPPRPAAAPAPPKTEPRRRVPRPQPRVSVSPPPPRRQPVRIASPRPLPPSRPPGAPQFDTARLWTRPSAVPPPQRARERAEAALSPRSRLPRTAARPQQQPQPQRPRREDVVPPRATYTHPQQQPQPRRPRREDIVPPRTIVTESRRGPSRHREPVRPWR